MRFQVGLERAVHGLRDELAGLRGDLRALTTALLAGRAVPEGERHGQGKQDASKQSQKPKRSHRGRRRARTEDPAHQGQ